MTLRVLSLSHQAAAAYKGKGRSQPTCRARGCRDRLGIPKPPPPGGGHAPRGAPSTRAARLLGRTHRPRLPGARCPRATLCQRPPCVRRAAHHRAKRRVGVWCSLPMLGPCAQRQRYAPACCAYRPTFIRCLSINPPPPPPPPSPCVLLLLLQLSLCLEGLEWKIINMLKEAVYRSLAPARSLSRVGVCGRR